MYVLSSHDSELPRIAPDVLLSALSGKSSLSLFNVLRKPSLTKSSLLSCYVLRSCHQYDQMTQDCAHALLKASQAQTPREAAVMVAFTERHDELHVLLTKRASHLRHHPGQVSFPGGAVDPEDSDIYATALREVKEEIGVEIAREHLLGRLNRILTFSGYLVTPVLGFVEPDYCATLDRNEVDDLFEIPLSYLLSPTVFVKQKVLYRGRQHAVYAFYYHGHLIWGVTANILYAFIQQLHQG